MRTSLAEKKSYTPDLSQLQSQCELNYWLLNQLSSYFVRLGTLSEYSDLEKKQCMISSPSVCLAFEVTAVARYTTTMTLTVDSALEKFFSENGINGKNISSISLIIRLYHDAKMLEVMEGSGPSALSAVHDKPEHRLKPVDEKRQINLFVGECLRACATIKNTHCEII